MAAFHCCRHKESPHQYVGLQRPIPIGGASSARFKFTFLEDFLKVPIIGDLQIVEVQLRLSELVVFSSRAQFPGPAEFEHSSLRSCFQVLEDWASPCCLSWEYIVFGFWLVSRTSFLLRAKTPLWSNSWFSRLFESLKLLRRIFLHSQAVLWSQIHRSRLRHCRPFFQGTFLNSLGHVTLLSGWKKMAAGQHWEIHDV